MLNVNTTYKLPSSLKWYQLIFLLIIAAVISLPFAFSGQYINYVYMFTILIFLPVWIILLIQNNFISFIFDDNKLTINRGVLFKQNSNIPYHNIQSVKIKTGPIMGVFGLAGISIWTASQGQSSNRQSRPDGYLKLRKEDALTLENLLLKNNLQ